MEPSTPALNLTGVLSDSKKIIKSNYSHFLTLSLLFLPFSFSLIASPNLNLSDQLLAADHHNLRPNQPYLLYILTAYLLTLCAISTITYSTHSAFSGQPVNLSAAVKSLASAFLPLLATAVAAHVLLIIITIAFLLIIGSGFIVAQTLGFVIDYNSVYLVYFSYLIYAVLLAIMIYFHVSWSLAFVVVVVESRWGFSPLRRSANLIQGMRSVSLLLLLYFGVFGGLLVWVYDNNTSNNNVDGWVFVLMTILGVFFLMMILVRSSAANAVLYNYCKALHGELAIEVAEGFGQGYIILPSDDRNKETHVVTVVTAA